MNSLRDQGIRTVPVDLTAVRSLVAFVEYTSPVKRSAAPNLLTYARLFAPSTNVHRVGNQVINGVPTTEYAGTTTFAAA